MESRGLRDNRDCKVIVRVSYGSAGSQAVGTHVLSASLVNRLMQVAGAENWSEAGGSCAPGSARRVAWWSLAT